MVISVAATSRICVFTNPTDMRESFNGLLGLVAEHFEPLALGTLVSVIQSKTSLRQSPGLGSRWSNHLGKATEVENL